MSDRFKKYEDDEVRETVLAYEAVRASGGSRYFDIDEMEIVIDYYLDQNDIEHLDEAVRYAEQLFPDASSIRLRRVHLLCAKGLYERALPILKALQREEPDNGDVHYAFGVIYGAMSQPQQAIRHYLLAAKDKYALDVIYGNIGDEYRNLLNDAEAIKYYKKALAINYKEERSIRNLCFTYDQFNRLEEGEAFFSAFVKNHPYSCSGWYALALMYTFLMLYEKAIDAAEFALAIDKTFFDAYVCISNCYAEMHEPGKAATAMLDALPYTDSPEDVYYTIGTIYLDNNNISAAIIYFQKALDEDPYYSDALRGMASCCSRMGDTHTAIQYMERAITIMPNIPQYHFDAAHYYDQDGNFEDAEAHFQKVIDLDNTEDLYWTDYAIFLFYHQKYSEAIDLLQSGYDSALSPDKFDIVLAACYFRKGDLQSFRNIVMRHKDVTDKWVAYLVELCPESADAI